MTANLMDQLGQAEIHTLYQLRKKLQACSMNEWVAVLNDAHPWVKVRTMYRLKDKYDAVLTQFFPGTSHENYFDYLCHDLVDLNKLDTTFLSLCYHLESLAAQAGFDAPKRALFRQHVVREFTKRTYHLNTLPRRRKPEQILMDYLGLNAFVDWDRRMCDGSPRHGRVWLPTNLMRHKLAKLLYVDGQLNAQAYLFLQCQAMRFPGKLFSFLS